MTPNLTQTELELFDALIYHTLFHDDADEVVDGVMAMLETEREQKAMLYFLTATQRKLNITDIINYAFKLENARFE